MRGPDTSPESELYELAVQKAAAVLGMDRATRLIDRLLAELELELQLPRDLLSLSQAMTKLGGFEGAVGAMLGVVAVMRGAGASTRSDLQSDRHSP